MRISVTRQNSLFVFCLMTTIYAQTQVVFSTLLGISYLNTPITPGGLNYLSMEGGATLTITGSNMAQMSTMNQPYFEPKWLSGAQIYGPQLSRKFVFFLFSLAFDENKSQAMVGKLGYTVPPASTLMSTSYDSFNGVFLPSGLNANPLSFNLGVMNFADNNGVKCATLANCVINYNKDYTADLYDVTPPNVYKGQLIQFHFNSKWSQRSECTPADQFPFREIKLGETLVDWANTIVQTKRLTQWQRDTLEVYVGEQTPNLHSDPKILFYNGFVHKLASSMHCNFAGDDCWTVRSHPKIDSLSQNEGFTTGGQILNIKGHGLNGTDIKVTVDGIPCHVVENDTNQITCETGISAQPSLTGFQAGTPGLKRVKTDYAGVIQSIDLLTSLENFNLNGNMEEIWDNTQNNITGWFKAPTTGQYRFYISCDYGCSLSLDVINPYQPGSPLAGKPNPTVVARRGWGINWRQYMYQKSEGQKSNWIQLEAGNYYYLNAITANNRVSTHMTVSLEIIPDDLSHNTTKIHPKITKTIQQIAMEVNNTSEEWWITILTPDAGTYKINLLNPTVTPNSFWQSGEISSSATWVQFRDALSSYYWDNFRASIQITKTMYDANSAVTTQTFLATSVEFRVKLLKQIRGFSANAISVTKINTNSTITVTAPNKGGIISSPPLNGTFALICYQNGNAFQSGDMNYNIGPIWIEKMIQDTIPFLNGKVKVEYDYRYQYPENGISFLVNFDGMDNEVDLCKIVPGAGLYPLTGGEMYQNETILQNYGKSIMFEPVTLEFLYSDAQSPYVQIEINGIPALCPNLNCNFIYILPPAEITDQSLQASDLLTITGTNLPTDTTLDISFGPVSCSLVTVSNTEYICQLNSHPVTGDWIALVRSDLGVIPNVIATPINIPVQVTSLSPIVPINYLGGEILTISGDNFGFDTSCIDVVFGDNTACQVVSASMTTITCMTNRLATSTQVSTSISFTINQLTNSNPLTIDINEFVKQAISLTPNSVSPVLKSEITIYLDPTQFTDILIREEFQAVLYSSVDLNLKKELFIMSVDDSTKSLKVKFAGAKTGIYNIQVSSIQFGRLMSDTLVLDVHASVTSISPLTGSKLGGTLITITGENFSNDHLDNPVKIGADYCYVITSSPTQITCRTDLLASQTEQDELVLVFLKTSEEAGTPQGQDIFFTYQSPSATITDISVAFDSALNTNVVTVTGTGLDQTTELFIDGIFQQQVSITQDGTLAAFQVNDLKSFTSSDIQVFTNQGYPDGSQIAHSLTFKPSLFGIYPITGSSSGSWIQIHGNGFVQNTTGLNILADTQTLCKQLNCIDFFTCNCLTNALTLSSSTIYDFTLNGVKQSSYVQSDVTYSQAEMYTVTSVVITDNTITFIGTDFPTNSIAIASFNGVQTKNTIIESSSSVIATFSESGIPAGTGIPQLSFEVENNVAHFAPINQSLTKSIIVTSSSQDMKCSFAGGCNYNIQSNGLFSTLQNSLNTVTLCGNKCLLLPDQSDANQISCVLPPLATTYSVNTYQINQADILVGSIFPTGSAGAMLKDDVLTKDYIDTKTTGCNFGMTFKPSQIAVLDEAKFFINFLTNKTQFVNNLQFQGSNDNWATTTLLWTFGQEIHEGWNYINYRDNATKPAFNSYRFYGLKSGSCRVSEFKLIGVEAVADANPSTTCTPQINIAGVPLTNTILNHVIYDSLVTPLITDISPRFGSVLGNTIVILTGSNLLGLGSSTVLFDKRQCQIQSQTDIEIQCLTQHKPYVPDSPEAIVIIDGFGNAATQGLTFTYVSLWSDTETWGGDLPPIEGESVAIPKGQHLLVDIENSPILFAIIVEGSLIFAPDNLNPNHLRTFDAYYIMIQHGHMEVGTEKFPYTSKLIITMHGDRFSPYLPAFGNKVIAVRFGILDMHGIKRDVTWTRLAFTAHIGDTEITLLQPTDWAVGEEIAIATTSYENTEHETRIITAVAQQGTVISFAEPLLFDHISVVATYGGVDMPMQGEVGLLTRNVVFRGDPIVSQRDMFGAHIMLHSPGDESAIGRIEYIELRDVGQAYKIGRYAIHFHCIGTVMKSYVKGNAIHQSFNRAVTTHAVHYFRVTDNVAFDVFGHAFFVEDGVETNNLYDHNLAMNIKSSNSLLNTDQSPAGFWITNPNNIIINNAVAGTDAYCYWYDLEPNSQGGSFDVNICPQSTKLGEFRDNTAHSPHKYGLRIHHVLIPRAQACDPSPYDINYLTLGKTDPYWKNPRVPAIFNNLIAWKCGHNGAITERTGHVIFNNFKIADSGIAGIEFSVIEDIIDGYAKVTGGIVIGNTGFNDFNGTTSNRTTWGFIGPRTEGMTVTGTSFYNFDFQESAALGTCSHCFHPAATNTGGYTTTVSNLTFDDATVPRRIRYQIPFREIWYDLDGSLTGLGPNTWATPYMIHNDQPECQNTILHAGLICSSAVQVRRVSFYGDWQPKSLRMIKLKVAKWDKDFEATLKADNATYNEFLLDKNETRWSRYEMREKIDDGNSWPLPMVTGHRYRFHWGEGIDFTFMRFRISPERYLPTDLNIHMMTNFTDVRASINNTDQAGTLIANMTYVNKTESELVMGDNVIYNQTKVREFQFVVNGKDIKKRSIIKMQGFRCVWDCVKTVVVVNITNTTKLWSDPKSWPKGVVPIAGDDVEIIPGANIILDINTPLLKSLTINGRLTFLRNETNPLNLTIHTYWIYVHVGELLIGNETHPYNGEASIILYGSVTEESLYMSNYVEAGNKALVINGIAKFFGKSRDKVSRLKSTVFKGNTSAVVSDSLDWKSGDKIALLPTAQNHKHTDYMEILSYDNITGIVTFTKPLKFYHWGQETSTAPQYNGVDMRGEVIMLSRNVKVIGNNTDNWGGQILVSDVQEIETGVQRFGKLVLEHVEVYNCSQRDTFKSAIRWENAVLGYSSVTNTSVWGGHGWSISMQGSENIYVDSSTFIGALAIGLMVDSSNNITMNNLIVGDVLRRNMSGQSAVDKEACYAIGAYLNKKGSLQKDIVLTNSHAVGCVYAGFVVPGHNCGAEETQTNFKNNTAHSINGVGGVIYPDVLNEPSHDKCYSGSYFSAYKNQQQGVAVQFFSEDIRMSKLTLIDNQLGVNIQSSGENKIQRTQLSNSMIFGETAAEDCPKDQPGCICEDKMGFMLFGSNLNAKAPHIDAKTPLPMYKIKSYGSWMADTSIFGVVFQDFSSNLTACGAVNRVFGVNKYASDYIPVQKFKDITFNNVMQEAMISIYDPPEEWNNPDDCIGFPCTAPSNIVMLFEDVKYGGSTLPKNRSLNFQIVSDTPGASETFNSCTYQDEWNAWICQNKYLGHLSFIGDDFDWEDRMVAPVYVTNDATGYSNKINAMMDHVWDGFYTGQKHKSQFDSMIQTDQNYTVEYTGTPFKNMRYRLRSLSGQIKVKVPYWNAGAYSIYINGTYIPNTPWDKVNGRQAELTGRKGCGENRFVGVLNYLEFILTPNCEIQVKPLDSINANVRMQWTMSEFYAAGGTTSFCDRVAGALGISASQIKTVAVYTGSVVVDYYIAAVDPAKTTTTTTSSTSTANSLAKLKTKLNTLVTSNSTAFGAKVLSASTDQKAVITDPNYKPTLNPTPTNEVTAITKQAATPSATKVTVVTTLQDDKSVQMSETTKNSLIWIGVVVILLCSCCFGVGGLVFCCLGAKKFAPKQATAIQLAQAQKLQKADGDKSDNPDELKPQYNPAIGNFEIDIFDRKRVINKVNQEELVSEVAEQSAERASGRQLIVDHASMIHSMHEQSSKKLIPLTIEEQQVDDHHN